MATYGALAAIVPQIKTRTSLHVAPAGKLVEAKISIAHQSPYPVRVRIGVSSGALLAFAPSNYILYDLEIAAGETYETQTLYYANEQSLVVYSDSDLTSFLVHGEVLDNPYDVADWIISHRLEREKKVFSVLKDASRGTPDSLVEKVYSDVDSSLFPIAKASLLAHLIKLEEDKVITKEGEEYIWEGAN